MKVNRQRAMFGAAIILLAWLPMLAGPAIGAMWNWSTTASSNGSADPTINFREGQAPSSLNDSARALMAVVAGYRDDISGLLTTTGTASAYLVTTNSGLPNPPSDGQLLAVTVNVTNGVAPTLAADGGGAYPIQSAAGVAVGPATLVSGSPYTLKFSVSNNAWILRDLYGNPFNLPLAGGMDFWGTTLPNSSFAFANGQAISRTTYAALFAIMGTTYGSGDGTTTFNLPDKTGRVTAMKEAVATRLTSGVSGVDGSTMGSAGGGQSQTLTLAQLPTGITVNGTITVRPPSLSDYASNIFTFVQLSPTGGGNFLPSWGTNSGGIVHESTMTGVNTLTSNNTSGGAHPNVQPTIVCNYIIRII